MPREVECREPQVLHVLMLFATPGGERVARAMQIAECEGGRRPASRDGAQDKALGEFGAKREVHGVCIAQPGNQVE